MTATDGRQRAEPANTEPRKCAGWQWHHLEDLPMPMIPYARQALTYYRAGQAYSELGRPR